jgi:predicted ATPase
LVGKDDTTNVYRIPIRTPDQRLRVFVSSTLKELGQERAAAREAINRLRLSPVMFDLGARPHLARELYKAYIEQSHIFIGIYGNQYGWIAPEMEISGLEEEYLLAGRKPKLIYIKPDNPDRDPRLRKMLHTIRDREGISYKYFSTPDELSSLIENDLALLLSERFEAAQAGAIRTERKSNVPIPRTPLIGRETEMQALQALIEDAGVRVITLTGTGGSGKTRLSQELAHLRAGFFDEVWFVELASITDAELVIPTIAQTLDLREAGKRTAEEHLLDYFTDKSVLLILDNFEQVASAASIVARLLDKTRRLKVLITSRMPLRIRGEREFAVPPLEIPRFQDTASLDYLTECAAVKLFIQCVRGILPDFRIDEKSAPLMAKICTRLEGLPLAIELAAGRIRTIPLTAMVDRLEHLLPLLSKGARDLPARQQTMRSTIAWSYDLLNTPAKTLFTRLSVFSGGWTAEAAESVCAFDKKSGDEVLDTLESLIEINLVRSKIGIPGELRFEMLETIREYAAEILGESGERNDIGERHAVYYLRLTEIAEPYFRSNEREQWLSNIEQEIDNIRMVMSRSADRIISPAYGIRIVGLLGWFFHLRGHLREGRSWARAMLSLTEAAGRTLLRAKALFPAGGLAWSQSDYAEAIEYLEESASIFRELGDSFWQVQAQILLAGSLAGVKNYDRAYELSSECVQIARSTGDRWGEAYSLYWLGDIVFLKTADAGAARTLLDESAHIYSELRDNWGVAEAKGHLGVVATYQEDYTAAQKYLEASLLTMEQVGDRWALARGLTGLGDVFLNIRDFARASEYYKRGIYIWRELGNTPGIMMCLTGFARIAEKLELFEFAARLLGKIDQPYIILGILILPADSTEYEKFRNRIRERLTPGVWESETDNGHSMTMDELITFAVSRKFGEGTSE